MQWYQRSVIDVASELATSPQKGLTVAEALKRLRRDGQNVLPKKPQITIVTICVRQFLSPLMLVLCFAAFASLVIGKWEDSIVIGIAVLINVVVGCIQEWKAERAAEALRSYETPMCTVRRDGQIFEIATADLAVGDVVILAAGERVPADVRLTEVSALQVEEALLTGESEPVKKSVDPLGGKVVVADQSNMAFLGTLVLAGRAEGIVVAIGEKTQLGRIVSLTQETGDELTPIQVQLKRFSWFLGFVMVSLAVLLGGIGLLSGLAPYEVLSTAIALAVAAIPEGLLVGMTVILAIGMQRMFKRKALVKRLIAAETLGNVSVICTDKTGTLTEGKIKLTRIVTKAYDVQPSERIADEVYDALVMASLNNDATISPDGTCLGDTTECALLLGANDAYVDSVGKREKFIRLQEIPFSSERKFMATTHRSPRGEWLIVKGAPEVIFEMCSFDAGLRERYKLHAQKMADDGLRVLALATVTHDAIDFNVHKVGMEFVALFGLHDPLRSSAAATVEELRGAGIRTVVITGDHAATARSIARGAGVATSDDRVLEGAHLEALSDVQLRERLEMVDVFARVEPQHKVRVVKAWKDSGHSVAMTGDGVNDAPAIRAADIGVALGAGSDVTHEIADMVLLDNNLATIAAAVREGRTIFDNIRKIIVYLMVDSFSEIVLIAGAIFFGLPLPMTAVQILWINLVSDGFPYLALTMEPTEEGVMQEKPRPKSEHVVSREMKVMIFLIGIITDIGLFALFVTLLCYDFDLHTIRTMIFTALAVDSLLYVFSVRTMKSSLFRSHPFENPWMLPAVCAGFVLQASAVYIPFLQRLFATVSLLPYHWGIIVVLSLIKLVAIELTKEWFIHRRTRSV